MSGDLRTTTDPGAPAATPWDDLANGPMVESEEELNDVEVPASESTEELNTVEVHAKRDAYLNEAGKFINDEAKQEVYDAFRYAIESDPSKRTFDLFARDGFTFPNVKDPGFDAAMEDSSNWVPERVALQQESINKQINDALLLSRSLRAAEAERGVGPTIYALRGVSAAGKTQAIKKIPGAIVEDGFTVGALAPDVSKRDLFLASGGMTDQIHKESSMMTRRVEKALKAYAMEEEISDIRDRVLKDFSDVEDVIADAEETMRRVEMLDIDVPLEVSAMRLLLREKGGAEPNPNPNYLRDQAFSGVRKNRLAAIQQLKDAYNSGRVSDVSYSLLCYDYEGEPKEIQREAYKLWVEDGEIKEEILDQKLFEAATRVEEEELAVLENQEITPEYVESFCDKYYDKDEKSQSYADEMRKGVIFYMSLVPPKTLFEALADKNKVEKTA